jgi:hypothetical protein
LGDNTGKLTPNFSQRWRDEKYERAAKGYGGQTEIPTCIWLIGLSEIDNWENGRRMVFEKLKAWEDSEIKKQKPWH